MFRGIEMLCLSDGIDMNRYEYMTCFGIQLYSVSELSLSPGATAVESLEQMDCPEVCEFDNVRKRMSVLLRMPSGEILLYVKGADSSILPHVLEPGAPEKP